MPIAYIILLIISFIFSRQHFPFANLILILGLIVLLADVIVQFIRLMLKRIHISVMFCSVTLLFIGVGYTFLWLSWPGAKPPSIFGLVVSVVFIGYWLWRNHKPTIRFVMTVLLTMILGVFVSMKGSSFYCMKNNIDPNNPVAPVFIKHTLAWKYNVEGDFDAAMRILLLEKKYLEKRISETGPEKTSEDYTQVFQQDLKIVDQAFVDVSRRSWVNYEPLLPGDFQ